jgi:hypothetical protein
LAEVDKEAGMETENILVASGFQAKFIQTGM